MSKRFLAVLAMATAFMMTGAMVAEAADVKFTGQVRLRGEAWSGTGGNDLFRNGDWNSYIGNRMRLNANVKVDDSLSAFIQMQSTTMFGLDPASGANVPRGAHIGLSDPSDNSTDLGLHQAYFVQKNLFGSGLTIKAGRQEIVLDGHRLFGHTGWTTGAQAHDAIMFEHAHDKMTLRYYFSKQTENAGKSDAGDFGGPCVDDACDNDYHILWGNMKGLVGAKSSTSFYIVLADTNGFTPNDPASGSFVLDADFWTFGVRQAGSAGGLDYRVEGYIQEGKSGIPNALNTASGDSSGILLGARIGKKFGNVTMKPKLTLWADYLSGTDTADLAVGDTGGFNTLFDTGHKFYGFMDFFLGGQGLGLIDLAVKMAIQPAPKTTVKLDYHHFSRAEERGFATPGSSAEAKSLGSEIDLTVVYKYSANMKMVAGYSRFFATNLFYQGDTADNLYGDAQWAYLMMDMKF